jgi:hypothetical protein
VVFLFVATLHCTALALNSLTTMAWTTLHRNFCLKWPVKSDHCVLERSVFSPEWKLQGPILYTLWHKTYSNKSTGTITRPSNGWAQAEISFIIRIWFSVGLLHFVLGNLFNLPVFSLFILYFDMSRTHWGLHSLVVYIQSARIWYASVPLVPIRSCSTVITRILYLISLPVKEEVTVWITCLHQS